MLDCVLHEYYTGLTVQMVHRNTCKQENHTYIYTISICIYIYTYIYEWTTKNPLNFSGFLDMECRTVSVRT